MKVFVTVAVVNIIVLVFVLLLSVYFIFSMFRPFMVTSIAGERRRSCEYAA